MGIPGPCGWGGVRLCGVEAGGSGAFLTWPAPCLHSCPLPASRWRLLRLWARSRVLGLLGLEEPRAAAWDGPDGVTGWEADGPRQQLGRRRRRASPTLAVPCAGGGWGPEEDR